MKSSTLRIACVALALSACTSKPILQPNEKYNRVGYEHSERDIEICEKQADEQLKKSQGRRTKRAAIAGAIGGAVVGGVIGSTGHTGTVGGAVIGGAAGGLGGAAAGAMKTPEGARRNLVNYCLQKKGYSVAGWD